MTDRIRALSEKDVRALSKIYEDGYREFGYDERALRWSKVKQWARFDILTSHFDCRGKAILDIGCGFGDLILTLNEKAAGEYEYLGIDLSPSLVNRARIEYGGSPEIRFECGDFLAADIPEADFAIASGIFNIKLAEGDNDFFIFQTMTKAFDLCREGIAFDFLSDRVDYRLPESFHASPERILSLAHGLSRRVILRSDYMPFEFAIIVFKDDSFDPNDTIFHRWKGEKCKS
jgi:SAM-dependent methyltransferase